LFKQSIQTFGEKKSSNKASFLRDDEFAFCQDTPDLYHTTSEKDD